MNTLNRTLRTTALLSLLLLILPRDAHAWADRGHEIVGQIAEETIKPETRDWLRGLMGIEPLAVSAVFPDHVRGDERFGHQEADPAKREANYHNFDEFHYCEIPLGQTYESRSNKVAKDCFGSIEGAIRILKSTKRSPRDIAEKQIALRYLAHVVGDIGNPLHVGNGADRGGNLCKVRWTVDGANQITNLHAVWDDSLIQYLGKSYAAVSSNKKPAIYLGDYMKVIREKFKDSLNEAGKKKFGAGTTLSWVTESAELRESSGLYPDDTKAMKDVSVLDRPAHRSYCEMIQPKNVNFSSNELKSAAVSTGKAPDPSPTLKPVDLDRAYADKFAPLAETQMLKHGLRLAFLLDGIAESLKKSKPAKLTDKDEDAILKNVQDQLKNKK